MTQVKDERPDREKTGSQEPYRPGEAAKRKGEIPTGEHRNDEYGQGRQSGVVADDPNRPKKPKTAQEQELEMNEENR